MPTISVSDINGDMVYEARSEVILITVHNRIKGVVFGFPAGIPSSNMSPDEVEKRLSPFREDIVRILENGPEESIS